LPHVRSPWALVLAWLLSFGTHGTLVLCGYTLVGSLDPALELTDALAVMPVSNLAAYFPLSVGGAGAWEWALVELFALVDVDRASTLAAGLVLRATYLVVAGSGGVLAFLYPLRETK
jgi:uncharacterized membrane protein YbhN (UPF0104 family)